MIAGGRDNPRDGRHAALPSPDGYPGTIPQRDIEPQRGSVLRKARVIEKNPVFLFRSIPRRARGGGGGTGGRRGDEGEIVVLGGRRGDEGEIVVLGGRRGDEGEIVVRVVC